jgi:FAD synthetase
VVDEAILGYEGLDIGEVVKKIKPDIIALGWDQKEMEQEVTEFLSNHKMPTKIVQISKFGENTLDSSSKIKQKIIEKLTK